jgi:hypothetical protein
MPDIEFVDNQVLIRIPKALLVLTKQEFLQALKRGKAYRRREQRAKRMANAAQEDYGHPH